MVSCRSIFKDITMKAVIFDLDLTLVDTTVLEPYRHNRDWQGAYSNISRCTLYPGIPELFDFIRRNGVQVCIVSTSPRPYVERIVRYFNIPVNAIVGYHDAKPIKPAPQPMFKALELLIQVCLREGCCLHVGDKRVAGAFGIQSRCCH